MIESAVDDSHRTIAARALNKVKSSTFIILKNDHDTVGMGIFIAPDLAVTSNHVVVEVEDPDNIFALLPAEKQKLKLTCQFRDYRYDYAILPFPGGKHEHVDLWHGYSSELEGRRLALCTYLLGYKGFTEGVTVIEARGVQLSEHHHYLVYTSEMWPGDAGGALFLHNGKLVGIHTDGINHLQELKEMELDDVSDRISQVEESVREAISSLSSGSIATLATTFRLI